MTYPMQLIKARQMSAGKHTHADRQYTGTMNAIIRIWKSEGSFLKLHSCIHQLTCKSDLNGLVLLTKHDACQIAI